MRSEPVDLILRGGIVVDGSGDASRVGDISIDGGRIVAIGDLSHVTAREEIDVAGRIVAPGFVDLHSHADLILLGDRAQQEELLAAKISQGVTTLVVGNCGLGVAPADDGAADLLSAVNGWMTPEGIVAGSGGVASYLDRLETQGVATNVATLIPHGPVRISAMGLAAGEPDADQLGRMAADVRRGLTEGAYGLSSGLIYPPGMYSDTTELAQLAGIVAEFDGLFAAHIRGSSETLLPATDELIHIARASGARVHHSHLEAVGESHWEKIAEVLAREDRAREEGLRLSHDVFPYTRAATMMAAIFPPWSLEGGVPKLLERLREPHERRRIRESIETTIPQWPPWVEGGWPHNLVGAVGWDGILVASLGGDGPTEWVGRSLAEIAAGLDRDPFDVVADLMLEQQGHVGQQVAEISGRADRLEHLLSILQHPAAAVISDAEDYGRGAPHPAQAGAFARALRWNRERELMPLPEMLRRMSGYPAALLGLPERGRLQVGGPADIVVLEAELVADRADWDTPRRRADGIFLVMLNGTVVVDDGEYLGGLHGRVLRSNQRN